MNQSRLDILETIRKNPGATREDIAAASGWTIGTVLRAVADLLDLGLITSEPARVLCKDGRLRIAATYRGNPL